MAAANDARVSIVSGVLFVLLLGSLHLLEPEFNSSWRFLSEYELGKFGWLMRLAFLALATSLPPRQRLSPNEVTGKVVPSTSAKGVLRPILRRGRATTLIPRHISLHRRLLRVHPIRLLRIQHIQGQRPVVQHFVVERYLSALLRSLRRVVLFVCLTAASTTTARL